MKKLILLAIVFTWQLNFLYAQRDIGKRDTLSNIDISLLTYSPGSELYSLFGHSALRIRNKYTGEDHVFNYGTFDWEQAYFYFRFLRGNLLYSLSKVPYSYVQHTVALENRSLVETPLLLTGKEKERIIEFLQNNLKPENTF